MLAQPLYLDNHVPFQARYWKDPYEFNPSRFLGDWDRDAFLPFSAGMKVIRLSNHLLKHCTGTRACLGRRYVTVSLSSNYLKAVQVLRDGKFSNALYDYLALQD